MIDVHVNVLRRLAYFLLFLEGIAYVYWLVVLGFVASRQPAGLIDWILEATHYAGTYAMLQGLGELEKYRDETEIHPAKAATPSFRLGMEWALTILIALPAEVALVIFRFKANEIIDSSTSKMLTAVAITFLALNCLNFLWSLALWWVLWNESPIQETFISRTMGLKKRLHRPASEDRAPLRE
jgi:hypothetical protein